tara:strand:- start:774 stop:1157 length:384 start_codon:yes stop_codon:yes gene_type:complete
MLNIKYWLGKGKIMAIEKSAGGTMYTGRDVIRYQVTVLNFGIENETIHKGSYFETMFTLYRQGKLQFGEIAEMFRFATMYKRSSNPVMSDQEKEDREIMVENNWFTNKGEWLVDIDELSKKYYSEGE